MSVLKVFSLTIPCIILGLIKIYGNYQHLSVFFLPKKSIKLHLFILNSLVSSSLILRMVQQSISKVHYSRAHLISGLWWVGYYVLHVHHLSFKVYVSRFLGFQYKGLRFHCLYIRRTVSLSAG